MAKAKKEKKAKRERRERRFVPRSTTKPLTVKILGGLGAATMGVGAWAQYGRALLSQEQTVSPYPFAPWVLAAGAALFGVAVWLGTSAEPPVRVGAAGIAVERGEIRRMAWYDVGHISWSSDKDLLEIRGTDEAGKDWTFILNPLSHAQACAWFLKEARERVPKVVDVPDSPRGVPEARPQEGQLIVLDAVQVVGKRCMESDTLIAYEPDARICPRCERIYHKHHVPDECACGGSLAGMRVPEDGHESAAPSEPKPESLKDHA